MDRREYLGGSDIGCIFGVSPWKSALDLYEEKIAETYIEPQIEPEREKLFRRGKKLEPWVMELLEEERGITIFKRNQRYTDPVCPWMACEIDFEYTDIEGLCNGDVKTISPFAAGDWGAQGTDEFPLSYCLQFMWGMMITDRPKCLVAALIGADDLRVYEVRRDEELIAEIRRRATEFWQENVQKRIPPAPQTVDDTRKLLSKFGGFAIPADDTVLESLRRLREVKTAEKELKKLKDQYEQEVQRWLLIQAQLVGAGDDTKKFVINDCTGKRTASLSYQHREGYTVGATDFWVLRS